MLRASLVVIARSPSISQFNLIKIRVSIHLNKNLFFNPDELPHVNDARDDGRCLAIVL